MDISEYIREPFGAAVFAAGVTAAYIHVKKEMNNEGQKELSDYVKPALLVGLLVYFIVHNGSGAKESLLKEPF